MSLRQFVCVCVARRYFLETARTASFWLIEIISFFLHRVRIKPFVQLAFKYGQITYIVCLYAAVFAAIGPKPII